MCQFHLQLFILRTVSAVWPFSVTGHLRGKGELYNLVSEEIPGDLSMKKKPISSIFVGMLVMALGETFGNNEVGNRSVLSQIKIIYVFKILNILQNCLIHHQKVYLISVARKL